MRKTSLFLMLFGGVALAAVVGIVGNMVRLGSSTSAARPSSSSTIVGSMLWVSDVDAGTGVPGAIQYNDSVAWRQLAIDGVSGSGSTSYWFDGGVWAVNPTPGYIFAHPAIANPDAGTAMILYQEWVDFTAADVPRTLILAGRGTSGFGTPAPGGRVVFSRPAADYSTFTDYAAIYGSAGVGSSPFAANGLTYEGSENLWTSLGRTTRRGALNTTGEWLSYASSGNNAYSVDTNGARYNIGSGSNDYIVSNGTRAGTPGDWELSGTSVTQLYASGNSAFGIINAGITAGTATDTVPAAVLYTGNGLDVGDAILEVSNGALRNYMLTVYNASPVKTWYGIEIGSITGGAPDGGVGADPIYASYVTRYTPDGGDVAAATCQDNVLAKSGARSGDTCALGLATAPTSPAEGIRCFVTASDVVTLQVCNNSALVAITPVGVRTCRCFRETP